jgi:hypothetical protein
MRWLTFLLFVCTALPLSAKTQPSSDLVSPPPGATIPVFLNKTLKAGNIVPGQTITAPFTQRVPVSSTAYLPGRAEIVGHVVSASPNSLSIQFTELRWKGKTAPIRLKLLAAASSQNTYDTQLPLGGTDRGTSDSADWTTRQIGGDEVYLSAGSGKVYNRVSEPVGQADFSGVYADPSPAYALPRAVGPFSTTATGLHGLADFSIKSDGAYGEPITLEASKPRWKIDGGGAMLLEVLK